MAGCPAGDLHAEPDAVRVGIPVARQLADAHPNAHSRPDADADATGYRVYRSASPDGPFERSASYDVATDKSTVETGVWHEYIHIRAQAPGFRYIEVTTEDPTYFRVSAFSSAGEGPLSVVVCGVSPTSSSEC